MTAAAGLRPPEVQAFTIGEGAVPLYVVDGFFPRPEQLLSSARADKFTDEYSDFYPGVRQLLPEQYQQYVCDFASNHVLSNIKVETASRVTASLCAFSVTTTPPEKLLPIQRIPHFDTTDPNQWAVVHYLCDATKGGTGFFRHKDTGYQSITEDNQKRYMRVLEDEAVTKGLPPAKYLQGDSPLFELVHQVEARFNRAIFYPSNTLHSGLIKQWQPDALANSRITANTFLHITPIS